MLLTNHVNPPSGVWLRRLLTSFFLLLCLGLSAQEVCNNGIDDDGDMLIDLNDPDCACSTGNQVVTGIISNPSFESSTCCPSVPSQTTCVDDWQQGGPGSSDYFNTCNYTSLGTIDDPDFPLPGGGSGYAGFWATNGTLEYLGSCLSSPFLAGTTYTLEFSTSVGNAFPSFALNLSVFGTSTCADLPWAGALCPSGIGNWQQLGSSSVTYAAQSAWQTVQYTFTPTVDINALAIGPSCGTPVSQGYFYIDNLQVIAPSTSGTPSTITQSGNFCAGSLVLNAANPTPGGTWQWYQNGIALVGETADTLAASAYGSGPYTALYSFAGGGCIQAHDTVMVSGGSLTVQPLPAINVQCSANVPVANTGIVTATGTGTIQIAHLGDASNNNSCSELITRTYQVTDACDTLQVQQLITVQDTIAPTATAPADLVVSCLSDVPMFDSTVVTGVSDNCTLNPTVTLASEVTSGASCNNQVITRTYAIADACGNTTQVSHQISISATVATITAGNDTAICEGEPITLTALNPGSVTINWNNGVVDGMPFVPPVGINLYVVSAATCGGQCTSTDTIEVTVWENPEALFTSTVDCGTTTVDFMNNSSATAPATLTSVIWDFGDNTGSNQNDPTHTYAVTNNYNVQLLVTDSRGCQDSVLQTVSVVNAPLLASTLDTINVQCASDVPLPDPMSIMASGTGTISVNHLSDVSNGNNSCSEVITRTYEVLDDCDTLLLTQILIISDTIPPNAVAPADISVNCASDVPAVDISVVTGISDNCTSVPTVALANETSAGSSCNNQVITRVYSVTDNCGNSIQVSHQITVLASPPNASAGNDTTLCFGEAIALTALNPGGAAISWSGGVTDGVAFNPPVGVNTYVLTADVCNGQCLATDTVRVTVADSIEANFTWVGACGSTLVNFFDSSTATAPATITNYQWDFGDLNTSAQANPTHTYVNGGTYTVQLTVADNFGCQDSVTQMLSVANTPLMASNLPNLQVQCLSAVPLPDPSQVTAAGTGNVVVSHLSDVSDNNSCPETIVRTYQVIDACDTVIVQRTIEVEDTIAPQANSLADLVVSCASDVPPADVTIVTGVSDNCTPVPVVTLQSETMSGANCNNEVITRIYAVTDACGNRTLVSHDIRITAQVPTINAGADTAVCEGESIVLTANASDGVQVSWSGGVGNGVSFEPMVGSSTFVVSGNVCNGQCVSVDSVTVTTWLKPTAAFAGDDLEGCEPHAVNFSDLSSGGTACVWTLGDGTTLNGCGDFSHTYTAPGDYFVSLIVTNANGCADTLDQPNYIQVEEQPFADFSFSPEQIDLFNTQVDFVNLSTGGNLYTWSFGDGNTSNETDPTYSFPFEPQSGYDVTLLVSNAIGCVDSISYFIPVLESILVHVPNAFSPNGDQVNDAFAPVLSGLSGVQGYEFNIFNRWGELIFQSDIPGESWDGMNPDGTPVQMDVYVWQLSVKEAGNPKRFNKTGHVTLIR